MTLQEQRNVTLTLPATDEGTGAAAELLQQGALVAFPTETVYGLGGDARNAEAVAAIYAAKGRPSTNPLIVHVASLSMARAIAVFNDTADRLAQAQWPGGLTLVLPARDDAGLADAVTAGLGTVALRWPAHDLAQDLIARAGTPIAAPSANPSGRVSATTVQHVLDGLGGRIAAVLDGGSTVIGLESTIVSALDTPPTILREGALSAEDLGLADIPQPIVTDKPTAPGQLASHYAPKGRVRLNAITTEPGEVMIGFGQIAGDVSLSDTGNLEEAAQRLYAILHQMDSSGATAIAVAPIPDQGIGRAINDRLRRAAAPRS